MKVLRRVRRRHQADIGFAAKRRRAAVGDADDLRAGPARALDRGQRVAAIGLKSHRHEAIALVHADQVVRRQAAMTRCQDEIVEAHARDIPEVVGQRVGEAEAEHVDAPRRDHQVGGTLEFGDRLLGEHFLGIVEAGLGHAAENRRAAALAVELAQPLHPVRRAVDAAADEIAEALAHRIVTLEAEMARQAHEAVGLHLGVTGERAHRLQADLVRVIDDIARAQLQLPGQFVELGEQAFDYLFLRLRQGAFDQL